MSRGLSRRAFLGWSAGCVGALWPGRSWGGGGEPRAEGCLFLHLVGGPPHLDTFDPKPEAPSEYRGPFGVIRSRVPGVYVSELLPGVAWRLDRIALVRSVYHDGPPVHECGMQLLHSGRLFRDGSAWPAVGAVWSYLQGERRLGWAGRYAVLPYPAVDTGIAVDQGFGGGFLSPPLQAQRERLTGGTREDSRYGSTAFGRLCRRAVERLLRQPRSFLTITMYETVFDTLSWDCHGSGGALRTNLRDIGRQVAPAFDQAFSALLDDLDQTGLLERTLVVATGEFGRTPRVNAHGGRDHWAGVWTALLAGAGIRGGAVIGRSDAHGIEPAERPVRAEELAATILYALGVPPDAVLPGPDGLPVPAYPAAPLRELWS